MKKYTAIIGLEIHTELASDSKMFCACKNDSQEKEINKNVCPICLGHPGTLPVPNKKALEYVIMAGLALNCEINTKSKFDRKNYFYPDLPKGYQISQYDLPLCKQGALKLDNNEISITRIHIEEDTGKSSHPKGSKHTLIDFNRAGTPLMELVTDPVIKDSQEAKEFCQKFQQLLRYLEISNADMEKGEMRCEANVSIQEEGKFEIKGAEVKAKKGYKLNNKVEVKNINSFKALQKAIDFEIERQTKLIEKGEDIVSETRGYDDKNKSTKSQRAKESSADYRYFPEPDIPPIEINGSWLARLKNSLPELPHEKQKRFMKQYGLNGDMANVITYDKELANWTENVISELDAWIEANGDDAQRQEKKLAKNAVNMISSELIKHLKLNKQKISDIKFSAENFAELLCLNYQGKINSSACQTILNKMYETGGDPTDIMEELGLEQVNNSEALEKTIQEVLNKNNDQVAQYKAGKTNVIQFLLGKVMAESKGKANPITTKEILTKLLNK